MAEPFWLYRELVLLLNEDIISETGGAAGVRDEGQRQGITAPGQADRDGPVAVAQKSTIKDCADRSL